MRGARGVWSGDAAVIHVHISLSSHKRADGWYVRERWSNGGSGYTEYGPIPTIAEALRVEEERAEEILRWARDTHAAVQDV